MLVHRGMLEWMKTRPVSTEAAPAPDANASRTFTQLGALPAGWQAELVPMLATMVLNVSRE